MDHSYNAETINYYFGKNLSFTSNLCQPITVYLCSIFIKIEQIQQMDYIGVTQLAQKATDRVREIVV